MANNVYGSGLNNVGSYQVSGEPFVTGSTISSGQEEKIEFPQVTNNVTVKLDNPNNSLYMNGQVGYVTPLDFEAALGSTSGSFSVSWWHKREDTNEAVDDGSMRDYLWGFNDDANSTSTRNQCMQSYDNRIQFSPDGAKHFSWVGIYGVGSARYNTWHHTTVTIEVNEDGNALTASAYRDGVLWPAHTQWNKTQYLTGSGDSSFTGPVDWSAMGNGFSIGSKYQYEPEGWFRDVILWNRVLTPTEAGDLYQASASYGSLGFNPVGVEKVVWVKPSEKRQLNITELENLGVYGNKTLPVIFDDSPLPNSYDIAGDSPFTNSGSLRVHYRSTGSLPNVEANKHYWTLSSQNEQITMNVKSKEIYLSSDGGDVDYSLHADLTNIPTSRIYQHTGSGVDE